ncbi:hypothetical protein MJO28_005964 [Puccinia striiformis f. sp. tritici]|uniref:Kinase n=4 Tax=Puccinia striiformis TaxID=27350 RepID=A0A0L0V6Y8_9BASI|nr:hypothetical protein Pst134EA_011190 [Puccinia striiformis f. sp. tritici]KNE94774.1 hypothetical protein PSTG_11866 [Puccinia striiformis f. sp. tritici PST-78]POW12090.1 hypothetical protein PSHT_08201 [Puccinia striiformis]KAH9467548.1 hypothetical protein Pst134EA_011190 [Puccinia striiformis f. sp. tritici]KAI7934053.1 hypothetical protein MJO28_017287 [Puccinia striiformis f. sp. tritici]KAI7953417.1 hypothetical protein MJO28_005964 [Puccinia striiformis f. sp. tritici]
MAHFFLAHSPSFPATHHLQESGLHHPNVPAALDFSNWSKFTSQDVDVEPCISSTSQGTSSAQRANGGFNSPASLNLHDVPLKIVSESVKVEAASGLQEDFLAHIKSCIPFPKAGGHAWGVRLYKDDPTKLVKDTYELEAFFYENLARQLDKTLAIPWEGWRPHYLGWRKLPGFRNNRKRASIVVGNIAAATSGVPHDQDSSLFWHPNVIDIKLGKTLVSEDERAEKRQRKMDVAKKTTSGTFAMRLTGAELWDNLELEYKRFDKKYGHSVDSSGANLEEKFNAMFPISKIGQRGSVAGSSLTYSPGGLSPIMMQVILKSLIQQFKKLLEHVSEFKWRSPATSVLIVFEGDARRLEKVIESSSNISAKISDVRLIDFAYTKEHSEVDRDLVLGLKNTLEYLEKLHRNIAKS